MAPLLATGFDLKKRERGCREMVCLSRCCFSGGCIMQIYVDDDGDKISMVEKGEHIEFVDIVDFDSVFDFLHAFDFLHSFDFSDFCDFSVFTNSWRGMLGGFGWRQSGEVLTLFKEQADKVRPVS